ncbi:polysaccharide biosynthesis tyrosine autokinase [Zhenpiania hominis]|uniref:non-specific protein-tyrosine kinase n=1 Tax=Zhenpiania hominis TaxID=2763644 RepID=A0A923NIC4_9FIRM|nr:polysaccharide biosynthesis tyrosine autokinase [Zhenpiania hominis]MBC6679578.1 polysaccharide biosynthesis tyrosine autokinase [Zhenpiania hominis]
MLDIEFGNLQEPEYGRREALNSLRTNIQFSGSGLQTLLFTSCQPNEGKSTISFELAYSMATNGKKTVFVDADLRKSVTINRYKITNQRKRIGGLSHYLSMQATLDDVLCHTNVENMDIILSGPYTPNPTALFNEPAFDVLLQTLRKLYDYVIIDTPPLGAVIDAAVIAPKCDGAILVLEANMTNSRAAISVKKQLELVGSNILGVVLNKVPVRSSGYYYQYYGEYK